MNHQSLEENGIAETAAAFGPLGPGRTGLPVEEPEGGGGQRRKRRNERAEFVHERRCCPAENMCQWKGKVHSSCELGYDHEGCLVVSMVVGSIQANTKSCSRECDVLNRRVQCLNWA